MTNISELIDVPDRVHAGDFVLKLSEGVSAADETVRDYVVTEELQKTFDAALSLIRDAVLTTSSKAAFLHGSFGSGKSHFMAMLHLLLQKDPRARAKEELALVLHEHNDWIEPRKFLLVPYHLIGAKNLESAILGGYASKVLTLHPDAATPGFYRSEALLQDAARLRADLGDTKFFERLNEGKSNAGGWGKLAAGWTAESSERAASSAPESEERSRLVGDLIDRFFEVARGGSDFVDLDAGLSVMTHHAKSLGYHAVILFLDELILWLASKAADQGFVSNESHKLVKLVESQQMDRPVPIVSFVARQRELKEIVGDYTTGSELNAVNFVATHQLDRFETITLGDKNLPAIVEKRVLRPKDDAARLKIDDAFIKSTKIREEVLEILMTSHANREMFRKVYPFSPALVETLVAVSFLLQRERTALRIMKQLLVDQRDRLLLGDIVPVGDLFDYVAEGNQAFLDTLRSEFENAKKLYYQKLRPMLEREHALKFDDLPKLQLAEAKRLRNDDRLVKTILLSALAPNVESLKALTVKRLAALNHGTIVSPIANQEAQIVLGKVRKWAAEVGEIKVGDDAQNPTVSIHLSGVDTDSILAEVNSEDNTGNRIRKVKELLYRAFGIDAADAFSAVDLTWRATRRSAQVRLLNVREATPELLSNPGDDWRVLIDYPFDEQGYGPKDDIAKLDSFRVDKRARTIVWLPSFLSAETQKSLGLYVRLEYLLSGCENGAVGERLRSHTQHLSATERQAARNVFDSQRNSLRERLKAALEFAFGIRPGKDGAIDETLTLEPAEHFQSLDPALALKPPVATDLKTALNKLLDQALASQFPAHPLFAEETKFGRAALVRVLESFEKATQQPQGRLEIDKDKRKELSLIATPLKIATMYETHLVVNDDWKDHFLKKEAASNGASTTVGKLRQWIDEPAPMGLPKDLQNLIILAFATQTSRTFKRYNGPFPNAGVDNLPDELELYEQPLPHKSEWEAATLRLQKLFGEMFSRLVTASNVGRFGAYVKDQVKAYRNDCDRLLLVLKQYRDALFPQTDAARLRTAQEAVKLLDSLSAANEPTDAVKALASFKSSSTDEAIARSIKSAAAILGDLSDGNLRILKPLRAIADHDPRKGAADTTVELLRTTFDRDEYVDAIAPALKGAIDRATTILAQSVQPPTPPSGATPTPVDNPSRARILRSGSYEFSKADGVRQIERELTEAQKTSPDARLKVTWEIYEP
jgi:hypothetical protein